MPTNGRERHSRQATPTGRELRSLLETGIAGIARLADQPMSAPVPLPDEDVIPIEALLFRGRGALLRAIELREELKRRGGQPDAVMLGELYDLLDLALTD